MKPMWVGMTLLSMVLAVNAVQAEPPTLGKNPVTPVKNMKNDTQKIRFIPLEHASFVIQSDVSTIYVDPVGNPDDFKGFPYPDIILVTHSHPDHFDPELIKKLIQDRTQIVGPADVIGELGYGEILKNGQQKTFGQVNIQAVPMYNTTPSRTRFHPKGKGNGYLLTLEKKRIYISGDTEDIPEMRALKDIDYAFVCMNLPYTMTVEQAASAVLAFKPKVVFPYHYRGTDGFSDIEKFKKIVSENPEIKVRFLDWY